MYVVAEWGFELQSPQFDILATILHGILMLSDVLGYLFPSKKGKVRSGPFINNEVNRHIAYYISQLFFKGMALPGQSSTFQFNLECFHIVKILYFAFIVMANTEGCSMT